MLTTRGLSYRQLFKNEKRLFTNVLNTCDDNILLKKASDELAYFINEQFYMLYHFYIDEVKRAVNCEVVVPSSRDYNTDRFNYDKIDNIMVACIVFVETIKDVQDIVRFIRNKKVNFRIRSGGHSYVASSIANYEIIIDTSKMNKILCIDTIQ